MARGPYFIYSLTWAGSKAVYVGSTQNPGSRLNGHMSGNQNPNIATMIETRGEPVFTVLEVVANWILAAQQERHWILKLKSLDTHPGGLNRNLPRNPQNCEVGVNVLTGEELAAQRADLEPLVVEPMLAPLFPEPVRAGIIGFNPEKAKLERRRWLAEQLLATPERPLRRPHSSNKR